MQSARVLAVSAALLAATAWGGEKLIANDTFTDNGPVFNGVWFGEYGGAAVLLEPDPGDYPITITAVDILCVPTSSNGTGSLGAYILDVWDESGGAAMPPPTTSSGNRFSGGLQLTASTEQFNRFTFTTPIVVTSGKVFINVFEQLSSDFDGTTIGMDQGPLVPGHNWTFNAGTYKEITGTGTGDTSQPRNWIIRAVIDYPDPVPTVTAITPNEGYAGTTVDVVIEGTNFTPTSTAFLDQIPLTVVSVTPPSQLSAKVPAGIPVGPHDVIVKNGLEAGALLNGYTAFGDPDGGLPPPADGGTDAGSEVPKDGGSDAGAAGLTLESIDPADVFSGDETDLVLLGTGFDESAQVLIGKKLIDPIDRKSASVIQATLTPDLLAAGTYDVTVVNADGARATLTEALTVHDGTSVRTGCSCNSVAPAAALFPGLLFALAALRRRRRFRSRTKGSEMAA